MRDGSAVRAGTFPYEGDGLVTGWHSHDLHQIEYALAGTVEVETSAGHYLLPPQQAAWIPAQLPHRTTINRRVKTVSVFFHPDMVADPGDKARILAAAPVIREMIRYATRWPIDRLQSDEEADRFFTVLADLVSNGLDQEAPLHLPTSTDPVIAAVMAYTDDHLVQVTASEVSRAVGLSDRSLRRQFRAAVGMSWHRYLVHARLLRAMVLLAEPSWSVLGVATEVGFGSVSAFSRAFALHTGETPTAYRGRIASSPSP